VEPAARDSRSRHRRCGMGLSAGAGPRLRS
jgi:hypothetical protein